MFKNCTLLKFKISLLLTLTTFTLFPEGETSSLRPIMESIEVIGNKTIPEDTILYKVPYKIGEEFDAKHTASLIKSLYNLGYFKPNIQILIEQTPTGNIKLLIKLEEKDIPDKFTFEGFKKITENDIEKKTQYSNIRGIDEHNIKIMINQIQELYHEKDFHNAQITYEIIEIKKGHVEVKLIVEEGIKSFVKKVEFQGNKCFPSKKLRSIIYTREDWLLGFINKAGSFNPDMIEIDQNILQDFYRSNGFANARVTDTIIEEVPKGSCCYNVTFVINEGDIYTINEVSAKGGTEIMCEENIVANTGIRPGDLYSSKQIRQTMEILKLMWGEFGYVFAEVNTIPEINEKTKTVNLTFTTDLGERAICNKINIKGNNKTKDWVVRREILIDEGEMLTTRALETSKENIERLGYFDSKSGVNWDIIKLDDQRADLDLLLKEARTGRAYFEIRSGGDRDYQSPAKSIQIGGGIRTINFWGTGIKANLSGHVSYQDSDIALSIMDPWLFNRPLQGGATFTKQTLTYEDFLLTKNYPRESDIGGSVVFGFTTPWLGGTSCIFDLGVENIDFGEIIPQIPDFPDNKICKPNLEYIVKETFQSGNVLHLGASVSQDFKNHPINPNRGYAWLSSLKFAVPYKTNGFGYLKWDLDAHWYYPLINEYDLILHLHGHAGFVTEIGKYKIPYRELYHLGGPASVRGFLFGQIGPTLFKNNSLGGKKAFWVNAELLWPVTPDFNIVAYAFYDGGASWDTPLADQIKCALRNNKFLYRQAVGIGFKMRSPTPVNIAIGLKLDRNKRTGETVSEVHFSGNVDF